MVVCFPTLVLFILCCTDRRIRSPEEAGCPAQWLVKEELCCSTAAEEAFLDYFDTPVLPSGELAKSIGLLEGFLKYRAPLHVKAWRLHARLSAIFALVEGDAVKIAVAEVQAPHDLEGVRQKAVEASRVLTRALSRMENFQQFLVWHKASIVGAPAFTYDPEEIRADFASSIDLYKQVVVNHNQLVYELLPRLSRLLDKPRGAYQQDARMVRQPVVSIIVVMIGAIARMGFNTMWTVLQHRSTNIRFHVFGDDEGFEACQRAVRELNTTAEGAGLLRGVVMEYVNVDAHPAFVDYLSKHPTHCNFGTAGKAIMARVICHELLPEDVERAVSIDLGDVLVLEDILQLWKVGDELEEHEVMAAANAVPLYHINAGVVVYDVKKMRKMNFSNQTLFVAWEGLRKTGEDKCLRDQSIINVLHREREDYGLEGPSPVRELPCRWSLFPTTEWVALWNEPSAWLPEIRDRRRYHGIVSADHIELYCPDAMDMLTSFAFLPMTEPRGPRVSAYGQAAGQKTARHCSSTRPSPSCCACRERAALVHVAGDMKRWPAMRGLLRSFLPRWSDRPEDLLEESPSSVWWGGEARRSVLRGQSEARLYELGKEMGFDYRFLRGKDSCHTFTTSQSMPDALEYYAAKLKVQLPLRLEVESSADEGMYVHIGGKDGLEVAADSEGLTLRWVAGLVGAQPIRQRLKGWPETRLKRKSSKSDPALKWVRLLIRVFEEDSEMLVEVHFEDQSLGPMLSGCNMPEEVAKVLRKQPKLDVNVAAAPSRQQSRWAVCELN